MTPELLQEIRKRDQAIEIIIGQTQANYTMYTIQAERDRHALLQYITELTTCQWCGSPLTRHCTGICDSTNDDNNL